MQMEIACRQSQFWKFQLIIKLVKYSGEDTEKTHKVKPALDGKDQWELNSMKKYPLSHHIQ